MQTTFVALTIFVAFSGASAQAKKDIYYIDYRLVDQNSSYATFGQSRAVPCTSQGKICDPDCKRIWTCVNNGGELKPSLVDTCKGDETCNNGSCSATPSPECALEPSHKFVCPDEGVFPEPRTCKKYHYCIKEAGGGGGGITTTMAYSADADDLKDHERTCSGNRGYNPRTTYCDKTLTNDQCGAEYPVPICKTPGQHGALKDNNSIFYVCSIYNNAGDILYPYLYLCKDGNIYDGNYGCKSPK